MKYEGVVFDFNGTLFWDTPLHDKAWQIFLKKHGIIINDSQYISLIHGRINSKIFKTMFGEKITKKEIEDYSLAKEVIYQEICMENPISLAPGAEDFFDFLKEKGIPFTIATASCLYNVKFYYSHFKLDRWFLLEDIIYDDGNIKGKPHPELFDKAINKIQIPPDRTLIFEDSKAGITSALNAHAGKIIIVNSNNTCYPEFNFDVITHFVQVDRNLF